MNAVKQKRAKKATFPVVIQHGRLVIGLFEMMFNVNSNFVYKAARYSRSLLGQITHESHFFDSFFLRKAKWSELVEKHKALIDGFKTRIFLNYLEKVYIPMSEHQQDFLDKECQEAAKEHPKQDLKPHDGLMPQGILN